MSVNKAHPQLYYSNYRAALRQLITTPIAALSFSFYDSGMFKAEQHIDTLIIGQGLAGSILAWQLMQRGQRVFIVADETSPSASRVAAGLFNPVTGQRLVLQANAETVIPVAINFYRQLEQRFKQVFFYEKEMLRIFRNEKELLKFNQRSQDPAYTQYLGDGCTDHPLLKTTHGIFVQRNTGYLDTNALLDCFKTFFTAHASYIASCFNHAELVIKEKNVSWRGVDAQRVIFCEGFMAKENPWFNWLPFQPAKGEILSFTTDQQLPEQIINGGKWMLPVADGSFKTGATYDHDLTNIESSEAGETELMNGMQNLLSSPIDFKLLDHQVGVRPNTLDKQPFLGCHPSQPRLAIFNGFGSKGSMLIPYYAERFASHLTEGSPIPDEADISRISYD
ncbi:FAD-dependent oxidoreductase [Mariprofundus sp. NF]|nr:FAD-dependent oxidoreductase [Mariprofundus sp. NF]